MIGSLSMPSEVAFFSIEAMNCCWRCIRPKSVPTCRARTNDSAISPRMVDLPAGRSRLVYFGLSLMGASRQTSTPSTASTIWTKPFRLTPT